MKYEFNINIEFNYDGNPILAAIALRMTPVKKISRMIAEAIKKDLDRWVFENLPFDGPH
jgi:hypothetical protein